MDAAHIVVIDDSVIICKILETCLRRAGYKVTSFTDPVSALRALFVTQEIARPDVLVVDIGLPHIDGYDVIKRFRNHPACKQIPILVISGHNGMLDWLLARLAGANGYLLKPFRTQEVVALVQYYQGLELPREDSTPRW